MAEEKKGLMKRAFGSGKKEPEKPEIEPIKRQGHGFEFVTVDKALAANKYHVDEENPHIVLKDDIGPEQLPQLRKLALGCPAALFRVDEECNVEFDYRNCLECGACRLLCDETVMEKWEYPRGSYGIEHRFG